MSQFLRSGAARTVYSDAAKEAYESAGPDLRAHVNFETTEGAEAHVFRTTGRAIGRERAADLTELKNANITHGKVPCTLVDIYSSDVTDLFAQDTTNAPKELVKFAKTHARAVKRKETQQVIDALVAGVGTWAGTIVHGGVGMTIAKLVGAMKLLRKNDIDEPPCLLYTENQEADVLQLTQFTSADFAAAMGARKGEVQEGHYGVSAYKRIGSGRDETGLPKASTTRTCILFVPSAVGLVVGFNGELKTDITKSEHLWHRHTVYQRSQSKQIDGLGVVGIECTES